MGRRRNCERVTFLSWVSGKALLLNDLSIWQECRQYYGLQGRALATDLWVWQGLGTEGNPPKVAGVQGAVLLWTEGVCLPLFTRGTLIPKVLVCGSRTSGR